MPQQLDVALPESPVDDRPVAPRSGGSIDAPARPSLPRATPQAPSRPQRRPTAPAVVPPAVAPAPVAPPITASPAATDDAATSSWLAPLAVLVVGMFMSVLDTSIVNVAL